MIPEKWEDGGNRLEFLHEIFYWTRDISIYKDQLQKMRFPRTTRPNVLCGAVTFFTPRLLGPSCFKYRSSWLANPRPARSCRRVNFPTSYLERPKLLPHFTCLSTSDIEQGFNIWVYFSIEQIVMNHFRISASAILQLQPGPSHAQHSRYNPTPSPLSTTLGPSLPSSFHVNRSKVEA